jgi:hypothetical protein
LSSRISAALPYRSRRVARKFRFAFPPRRGTLDRLPRRSAGEGGVPCHAANCPPFTCPSSLLTAGLATGLATTHAAAIDIVFVHDQIADEILRLVDRNGDGDATDPGEATVFLDDSLPPDIGNDNAQGLVALGPSSILATDNFEPDNIVRAEDLNGDGDALDPGEAFVYFNGALPGGFTLTNPADLRRIGPAQYLLLDNNTLDEVNPEAVYLLEEINDDLIIDESEVSLFATFSPAGDSITTTFDIVLGNDGSLYTLDIADPDQIESVDILDPDAETKREWFDSVDLLNIAGYVLTGTVNELEYLTDSDELIFGASSLGGASAILAATDANGNGIIDNGFEIRVLWDENLSADNPSTGSPRDIVLGADGSLYWTDGLRDRVWRLVDRNGDGDYNDGNETRVFYDAVDAAAAGLPPIELALSIAAWSCAADLAEPFGTLDFGDVQAFVTSFTAGTPLADLNDDGIFDLADIQAYITAFNAGCP